MIVPPGYGIGDLIAVGQLVWKVCKACKGAPGEFQELSRELSSLHTTIHELEDEANTPNSLLNRRGSGRESELDCLLQNLSGVLEQIEDSRRDITASEGIRREHGIELGLQAQTWPLCDPSYWSI